MPEKFSYKEILDGCLLNHRKAQEQLYHRFYAAMMSLCLRYTKNEQDAIEVLQNGFLKVFKNIARYDATLGNLYTWIHAIMVNAAIDFIRQKSRFTPAVPLESIPCSTIENEVIQKLDAQELLAFIRELPPATQTVFNLYVIDGFNHREIGAMTGISEGTSKWHLSEARRQLKQRIKIQQSTA